MNQIVKIEEVEKLLELWPFFHEALEFLNKATSANLGWSNEQLLNTLYEAVRLPENEGAVLMLMNKRSLPLGFAVIRTDVPVFGGNSAYVILDYDNGKCPTAGEEIQQGIENWGAFHGYARLVTMCKRTTTAAQRRFRNRFKYKLTGSVFTKEL